MIVVPNSGPDREFFFQWDIEVVFPKKANCHRHTRLSLTLSLWFWVHCCYHPATPICRHFTFHQTLWEFCFLCFESAASTAYDGIIGAVHTTTWAGPAPGLARAGHTLLNLHLTAAVNSLLLYSQLQSGPDSDQKSDVIFPKNMSSVSIFPDDM